MLKAESSHEMSKTLTVFQFAVESRGWKSLKSMEPDSATIPMRSSVVIVQT